MGRSFIRANSDIAADARCLASAMMPYKNPDFSGVLELPLPLPLGRTSHLQKARFAIRGPIKSVIKIAQPHTHLEASQLNETSTEPPLN
jgi:hypothetical protein